MPSGLPRHGHPAVGPFVFDAFATSTGSRFHSFDSWHRWELEMRNPKMPPRTIEWPKLLDDGDPTPSFHEALTGFLPVLGVMLESSYVFLAYNSKLFDLPIYNVYNIPSKLRKHLSIPRPPNRMIGENMVTAQMTCPSRICWRFCRHSRCSILSHRIKSSPFENCVSGGAKERITKSQSCSNKGYVSWVHFHQFHQVCHAGPPKLLHLREILGKISRLLICVGGFPYLREDDPHSTNVQSCWKPTILQWLSDFSEANNDNFVLTSVVWLGWSISNACGDARVRSWEWLAIYFCRHKSLDDCTLGDNGAPPQFGCSSDSVTTLDIFRYFCFV